MTQTLTEQEVCAKLQVSKSTLRRWRERGNGPQYIKLERGVRYPEADLEQWIESRKGKQ